MEKLGSAILASSSSQMLLNGVPGPSFNHAKGLRQGDPLSPLLFILAIDPLQRMISLAEQNAILSPILPCLAKLRCSLYADDATIFTNPDREELLTLQSLLKVFSECSGLVTNLAKTEIYTI